MQWDVIAVIPPTHATNGNSTQEISMYHVCWQTQRLRLGRPCNEQASPHPFFDFSRPIGVKLLAFHGKCYLFIHLK